MGKSGLYTKQSSSSRAGDKNKQEIHYSVLSGKRRAKKSVKTKVSNLGLWVGLEWDQKRFQIESTSTPHLKEKEVLVELLKR